VVEEAVGGRAPTLRAFFPHVVAPQALETRLRGYLGSLGALGFPTSPEPTIAALADTDWTAAWREHFRPLPVGRRLLVAPPWDVPPASDRLVLIIEPGRAFGTGHHGSTAGCLVLLERVLGATSPATAIDLGTGSGILAIAAARLGVPAILAVDDDPDAVAVAAANAEINGVSSQVACRCGDAAALDAPPSPLVLANLLASAHVRLADRYRRLLAAGGALLLGGILDAEADEVRARLRAEGLPAVDAVALDGWTALECRAPVHDRA
jgi:ribosomal protein L11 methyltransferase